MNDEVLQFLDSARRRLETLLQRTRSSPTPNRSLEAELETSLKELDAARTLFQIPHATPRAPANATPKAFAPPSAEKQRQHILDQIPDGYLITALDGRIVHLNRAAAQLFKRARAYLVGKPLTELVAENDRKSVEVLLAKFRTAPAEQSLNLAMRRSHEAPFPASIKVSRLNGTPGELHWLIRDLSATRAADKAKQRAEFLVYASQLLSASSDFATRVERVTRLAVPAIADMCILHVRDANGLTLKVQVAHTDPAKEQELAQIESQHRIETVLPEPSENGHANDRRKFVTRVTDDLLTEIAYADEHLRVLRDLGLKSYISLPLKTHGKAFGAVTFATAESGRVYEQEDLILAEAFARRAALAIENALRYEEAQQTLAERDRAQALALQELKIPLNVMLNLTHVMQNQLKHSPTHTIDAPANAGASDTGELFQTHLDDMARTTDRLLTMVNDFAALNRIQNQTLKLYPAWFNLSELVYSLVENLRLQQADGRYPRDVKLRLELPTPPLSIRADEERLAQALTYLLDNAVKYSPRGGMVHVALGTEEGGDNPDTLCAHLVISDQGIGVPPGEQARIFQPFVRATNTMGRNISGLGVGLAICQEIITLHGGRVWVESEGIDRGSAFHILLPHVEQGFD